MKPNLGFLFALLFISVSSLSRAQSLPSFAMGGVEQRIALIIRSDGTCRSVVETVMPRMMAEQTVRMWERFEKTDADDDAENATAGETAARTKPLTDDELTKKLGEVMNTKDSQIEDDRRQFAVEVRKDTVQAGETRSYSSLEEMLGHGREIWSELGIRFENVRFEKDTNNLLRVTLTPRPGSGSYAKSLRSQWKTSGAKAEMKFVFPGRVVTSGFPGRETNATWITIDGTKEETIEAAAKLYDQPTVITAELGGLKLDRPLESKTLEREGRRSMEGANELPLTDAGPGFVAEPLRVTITTMNLFPEGEKYLNQGGAYTMQRTGLAVSAKLFAPKGRTILSASQVRCTKATDDKGRPLATGAENMDSEIDFTSFSSSGRDANSTPIELRLPLPQRDAQAIDEIAAEAVTVTAGSWKQVVLTNLQGSVSNEVSLAELLPGAKLVIRKISAKSRQLSVEVQLQGTDAIKRLDFQIKLSANRDFNSYTSERRFNNKGGQSTRTVMVQGYDSEMRDGAPGGEMSLVVRFPQDVKRERVRFTLKGLDLL